MHGDYIGAQRNIPELRCLQIGMGWFPSQVGGLNRYYRGLVESLPAQGVDVEKLVVGPRGAVDFDGLTVDAKLPMPLRMARIGYETSRLARRSHVHLLVTHFAPYAVPALTQRNLRGVPHIVHFHGPWSVESASQGRSRPVWIKRTIEYLSYKSADHIITLSKSFADVVTGEFGISRERVTIVEPGVDLAKFRPRTLDDFGPDVRTGLNALTVRRLVPRMGIDILLRAWAKAGEPGVLRIAGDGPMRSELEALTRTLCVEKSVKFLGSLPDDDLASRYREADLMVVPSIELEGFGLIVLESLASGTPVLASDVGGLGEFARRSPGCMTVAAGDVDALAVRLSALASGAELPSRDACREVASGMSWAASVSKIAAIYRGVVDHRG